ncbi:MAG: hypothetical protein JOY66_01050 [Acetobacteraceae bacterium]|nr:hypothetical protein [Acetobacteraceae bacterium]
MMNDPEPPPADLSLAGAVVDKAIEYMTGQNVSELAIASALLGGALALLSRGMADEAIVRILDNAIVSVRNGELHQQDSGIGVGPKA